MFTTEFRYNALKSVVQSQAAYATITEYKLASYCSIEKQINLCFHILPTIHLRLSPNLPTL